MQTNPVILKNVLSLVRTMPILVNIKKRNWESRLFFFFRKIELSCTTPSGTKRGQLMISAVIVSNYAVFILCSKKGRQDRLTKQHMHYLGKPPPFSLASLRFPHSKGQNSFKYVFLTPFGTPPLSLYSPPLLRPFPGTHLCSEEPSQ